MYTLYLFTLFISVVLQGNEAAAEKNNWDKNQEDIVSAFASFLKNSLTSLEDVKEKIHKQRNPAPNDDEEIEGGFTPLPPLGPPGGGDSGSSRPTGSYNGPTNNYGPPNNNYGPPNNNYGRPNNNYGPPNNNYGRPNNNYGPPNNNYGPPNNNYGPPNNNYGPPNNNYKPSYYDPPNNNDSPTYDSPRPPRSFVLHNRNNQNQPLLNEWSAASRLQG